jgi:hypothetical protein
LAGRSVARVARWFAAAIHCAPRRCLGDAAVLAVTGAKSAISASVYGRRSRTRAKFVRGGRLVREKVIGRSVRGFASRLVARGALFVANGTIRSGRRMLGMLAGRRMFALLHQPARQHHRRVFLEPGIQQLRDLLAQIGCVAEPRKLVALQGIAGRREKELPGRLGFVVQGDLQGKRGHRNRIITIVNNAQVRKYCGKLCKSSIGRCKELRSASARVWTP